LAERCGGGCRTGAARRGERVRLGLVGAGTVVAVIGALRLFHTLFVNKIALKALWSKLSTPVLACSWSQREALKGGHGDGRR
jgi:hypothetical protein